MPVVTWPLLDLDQAQVGYGADGGIVFDDPACPWLVTLWLGLQPGRTPRHQPRPAITTLRIDARDPARPIAAPRTARLPLAQMLHIAVTTTAMRAGDPNEVYYRLLAKPKPPGSRSWPDEHWRAVLTVYDWARTTRRAGGGLGTVGEFWGVHPNSTAMRWVAEARRRAAT